MRVFALLGGVVVALMTAVALAFWLATATIRLLARWGERYWPLRDGPISACAAGLAVVTAVVASVMAWLARAVFRALLPTLDSTKDWQPWMPAAWKSFLFVCVAVITGAIILGAASQAFGVLGAARRRRRLLDLDLPPSAEPHAKPLPGGRSIVILCDGTGNRPDGMEGGEPAATNIWRLHGTLACDETQVVWYQAGVGSNSSSTDAEARRTRAVLAAVGANVGAQAAMVFSRVNKALEGAFGTGISEGIINGYAQIVRNYRPGDRIYLMGFSRGAYTARCIAGVISRVGLLRAENLRYAEDMVRIYRTRDRQTDLVSVRPDLVHADPAIEFVGVFDTVASLGVPLWGWWFRFLPIWDNTPLTTDPAPACRHIYHALAMDERRSQFFPTLYQRPAADRPDKFQSLSQVWFRGAHSDVGGGYARRDLSDIALAWMMAAMKAHGLRFRAGAWKGLQPQALGPVHDELDRKPDWRIFGSWPRWHPVPGAGPDPAGTELHPSVLARAAAVEQRNGRLDLYPVPPDTTVPLAASARRDWERTGIIIEHGVLYRLTYVGGTWQDAEKQECGPAGQEAGLLDLRRWLKVGRRMRYQPWMRLVATVAHPRHWPPEERGLWALLVLLFKNDPQELVSQLAPVGQDLACPGSSILLRNLAPSGLLYLFANDWWQTASNNSGEIRLEIRRVQDTGGAGEPVWTLMGVAQGKPGYWTRLPPGGTPP